MLKMRTRKQPGSALALMGDFPREVLTDQGLRVEGLGPAVAVYRWQTPGVVHAVCFEDATTRLLAGTFGFDTGDLSELFQHIGRIDNRPDVLARYDAETEARRAELRRSHR